jgi:peptide/nickel transport system substrate-binding protein
VNSLHTASPRSASFRTRINTAIHSLSLTGKLVFYFLFVVFAGSALSLIWQINEAFLVEVPVAGGTIVEGVIGLPRYINPVLAVTDGDRDISALVYSGLMRQKNNGELVPDLAESYTLSSDQKEYIFTLRSGVTFHDGEPVTADDVIYTIEQIKNPAIKSPKRANWDGVIVEKIDDHTVKFVLKQAYTPFIENTTLGILPKHTWEHTTTESFPLDEANTNPVGAGPYKVKSIRKNNTGTPLSYELQVNRKYALGRPLINAVVFKFYPNEKTLQTAFENGDVDNINSISPLIATQLEQRGNTIHTATLPRVFGVYFNQTENPVLANAEVRHALDISVNRDYIVTTVLQSFGTPLTGPVPQRFIEDSPSSTTTPSYEASVAAANELLQKAGWIMNAQGIREKRTTNGTTTLAFSISTSEIPELTEVADILKQEWLKIGANVEVKVFESGQLNQNVIRPRKYDALLFGQIVNRDLDIYAFWHSSQKNDPGLNIALYSNVKADKSLEAIRTLSDKTARIAEYKKFEAEIKNDRPAVFLYTPDLIYVTSPDVKNVTIESLTNPSERFNEINNWYTETARVWKIFTNKQ